MVLAARLSARFRPRPAAEAQRLEDLLATAGPAHRPARRARSGPVVAAHAPGQEEPVRASAPGPVARHRCGEVVSDVDEAAVRGQLARPAPARRSPRSRHLERVTVPLSLPLQSRSCVFSCKPSPRPAMRPSSTSSCCSGTCSAAGPLYREWGNRAAQQQQARGLPRARRRPGGLRSSARDAQIKRGFHVMFSQDWSRRMRAECVGSAAIARRCCWPPRRCAHRRPKHLRARHAARLRALGRPPQLGLRHTGPPAGTHRAHGVGGSQRHWRARQRRQRRSRQRRDCRADGKRQRCARACAATCRATC